MYASLTADRFVGTNHRDGSREGAPRSVCTPQDLTLGRSFRSRAAWQVRARRLMPALPERLWQVKQECAKSETENEMLQTYIDSITKSMASQRD